MMDLDLKTGALWLGCALLCGTGLTTSCSSGSGGDTATTSGTTGTGGASTTGSTTAETSAAGTTGGIPCGAVGSPCCEGSCNDTGIVCVDDLCVDPLEFGGACTQDEHCESNLCLASGHCSKSCEVAEDCPPAPEWSCGPLASYPDSMCQCAPSGAEACDGHDNDCDGVVDDEAPCADPAFSCQSGECACDPANLCEGVCKHLASDELNCGACGMECAVGAECFEGHCLTTLATGQNIPARLAIDAASVYWVNNPDGTVMKVPLGGGALTTLASGQTHPQDVAVDATHVYWTNGGDGTGAVMKVALGGGAPTTLASGQVFPWSLAIDATHVYWSGSDEAATVQKVPLGGGAPVTLAAMEGSAWSIAVDATSAYWTVYDLVMKVPLAGGAPTELASVEAAQTNRIAVSASSVYWTTDDAIMMVPLAGGAPTTIASLPARPYAITVDTDSVYWTFGDEGGAVMKAPLGGGSPTTIASGQFAPLAVVVDATHAYWATYDGKVMKAPK